MSFRGWWTGTTTSMATDMGKSKKREAITSPGELQQAVAQFERMYIQDTIDEVGGNKPKAAKRLGISVATLYRKLQCQPNS